MVQLRFLLAAIFFAATFPLLAACSHSNPPTQPDNPAATIDPLPQPIVFQCDARAFTAARQAWVNGDPAYKDVLADIKNTAEKDLNDGPYTIVNKQHSLPNIDPHDYVSLAPYFWPNPDTPDGLPYVRRDGERNPQTADYDLHSLDGMTEHVYRLALAGYVTGDRRYSDRAALLIRAWFFDPATRMNPNLEHAQFVNGVNEGRGTGILEGNRFMNVIDGIGLLNASGPSSWSDDDRAKIAAWFTQYRNWMQTSAHGKSEAAATNNHGSWYAVQLTVYSLFLGDNVTAQQTCDAAKARIVNQILPDGEQPLELARTKAFTYSTFNLNALTLLANLGERVSVDLWNYKTDDGRSIRAAIEFLIPYATDEKKWPHQQIDGFSGGSLFIPLRRAAAAYHDPRYDQIADTLHGDRDNFRYPPTFPPATTQP